MGLIIVLFKVHPPIYFGRPRLKIGLILMPPAFVVCFLKSEFVPYKC
jgi:hypothetical protein